MAERTSPPAAGALWFLSEREELVRRFVLRTLLTPPPAARLLRARRRARR